MKESQYNIKRKLSTGNYLVFNSSTCSLVELNEEYMYVLEHLSKCIDDEKNQQIIKDLYSIGFIIDDDLDELGMLQIFHNKNKFNNEALNLTIAPTLDCNFSCPYCFENKRKGKMTANVQQKLIEIIKNNVTPSQPLYITWYGGEPLLAMDVIENLNKHIKELVSKNNIGYAAFMITNGYLIDENMVQRLKNLSLKAVQITLDGPPEIHNKRRIFKRGHVDTFTKIITAIKLLIENNIDVVIRVNIDKINYPYLPHLLDLLIRNGLSNVKIALGHVLPYNNINGDINNTCFTKEEYADTIYKLQTLLNQKNFKHNNYLYPHPKCVYCSSINLNSFLVDHEGYLYKCWCDVGNIQHSIGNIKNLNNDFKLSNLKNYKSNTKLLTYSPFNNNECINCKILPICMGGCPKIATKNPNNNDCVCWKYNIDKLIEYTFKINAQ